MIPIFAACCLVAGLYVSQAAASVCSYNIMIDNFSRYEVKRNSYGLKASDDYSMTRISAADGMISFVPGAGSYFYETVPCIDAVASGYRAIAFTMRAPPDSSITLEMQTMSSCADPTHHSTYRYVMDFTGDLQRVTIPLSSFVGADTTAISGFSWATWEFYGDKNFVWQLGDVEFICGADAAKGLDGVELPTRSLSGNSTETV